MTHHYKVTASLSLKRENKKKEMVFKMRVRPAKSKLKMPV